MASKSVFKKQNINDNFILQVWHFVWMCVMLLNVVMLKWFQLVLQNRSLHDWLDTIELSKEKIILNYLSMCLLGEAYLNLTMLRKHYVIKNFSSSPHFIMLMIRLTVWQETKHVQCCTKENVSIGTKIPSFKIFLDFKTFLIVWKYICLCYDIMTFLIFRTLKRVLSLKLFIKRV